MTSRAQSELAREAREIADEWDAHLSALLDGTLDEARRRAAATAFRERWPALARWKDAVLSQRERHPPAIVAAALEVMSVECTLAGEEDLAIRARCAAIDTVVNRRSPSIPRSELAAAGD